MTAGWDREEVRKLDGWEDRGREGITSPTRPSWVAGRRPPNSVHRTERITEEADGRVTGGDATGLYTGAGRGRVAAQDSNEAQANQMEWTRRKVVEESVLRSVRRALPGDLGPGWTADGAAANDRAAREVAVVWWEGAWMDGCLFHNTTTPMLVNAPPVALPQIQCLMRHVAWLP